MIKIIRWIGYVAHIGAMRNVHRILVGTPEGKKPPGRLAVDWRIILK
jgi:hypothetical protein